MKLIPHPTSAGWMFYYDAEIKMVAVLDVNLNLISDEFAEELGEAVKAAIKDALKNPPRIQNPDLW